MKNYLICFLLVIGLAISSCGDDESDDKIPAPDLEKGFVSGKAVDTQGKPLAGVEIIIDNTYLYNSNLLGNTDSKGEYRIKLASGTFQAYARYKKTYNGKEYVIELHPDNDAGFSPEGAIRNFEWKLTGKKPGTSSGYYGGSIEIDKDINSQIYDTENIEFTLNPVGPLIDGTEGQVIAKKTGQPQTEAYGKLLDLPIGRYNLSAVYKGASGDIPLKLKNFQNQNAAYLPVLEVNFEPQTSSCFNCMNILYTE